MNKLPLRSIDARWESEEYIFVEHYENGKLGNFEIVIWDDNLKTNFKALVLGRDGYDLPKLLTGYVKDGRIKKRASSGKICIYFKDNKVHRDKGPAMIWTFNNKLYKTWFKNGVIHRDDGPARITPVRHFWYTNGSVVKSMDIETLQEDTLKNTIFNHLREHCNQIVNENK